MLSCLCQHWHIFFRWMQGIFHFFVRHFSHSVSWLHRQPLGLIVCASAPSPEFFIYSLPFIVRFRFTKPLRHESLLVYHDVLVHMLALLRCDKKCGAIEELMETEGDRKWDRWNMAKEKWRENWRKLVTHKLLDVFFVCPFAHSHIKRAVISVKLPFEHTACNGIGD